MPRLHELDAYGLSGCLAPKFTKTEEDDAEKTSAAQLKISAHKTKGTYVQNIPKYTPLQNTSDSLGKIGIIVRSTLSTLICHQNQVYTPTF